MDPMFEVFQILDNTDHEEHENLLIDLSSLDTNELETYVKENHIDHFLRRTEDKDIGRKAYFLIYQLHK